MAFTGPAIKVEVKGTAELLRITDPRRYDRALDRGLTKVALKVEEHAKHEVPRKTSRLGRSIDMVGARTGPTRIVAAGNSEVNYAVYVHEGTGPHDIVPRRKKVLFFPSQGVTTERFGSRAKLKFRKTGALSEGSKRRYGNAAYIATKRVRHPGTRANPFFQRAVDQTDAGPLMASEFDKVFRGRD